MCYSLANYNRIREDRDLTRLVLQLSAVALALTALVGLVAGLAIQPRVLVGMAGALPAAVFAGMLALRLDPLPSTAFADESELRDMRTESRLACLCAFFTTIALVVAMGNGA